MATLRMEMDVFEDVLEKVPGKNMTAKVRYLIQFYDEIVSGKEITFIKTKHTKGEDGELVEKKEVKKAIYSERLDMLHEKMSSNIARDLGITLEELKEMGAL